MSVQESFFFVVEIAIQSQSLSVLLLWLKCLAFFARLSKLGSVNAKPVYKFMLAIKSPSLESFQKSIHACAEASMIHLEAMARERCGVFLYGESNETLAKDYITDAYWLYQDWGAYAKALQMSEQYEFLKVSVVLCTSLFLRFAQLYNSRILHSPLSKELQEGDCY